MLYETKTKLASCNLFAKTWVGADKIYLINWQAFYIHAESLPID